MIISYIAVMMESNANAANLARPRGRPREFDVDAALDRAIAVFIARGYHGTAISDLTDALDLTAGSIYKAFGDKRGILLAAFDRYRAVRSGKLSDAVAAVSLGRDKVRAAMVFYAEAAHGAPGNRGCLVVSMTTELAASDPAVAERVAAAHRANETVLSELVLLGQADGSIPASVDAEAAACTLLCTMLGMRVIGKTGRSRDRMITVADTAMKILG